jgi:hypothetical protein
MTVWPPKSIVSVSGFSKRRTSELRPTEAICAWVALANCAVLLSRRKSTVNQQRSAGDISRLGTGQVCRHRRNLIRGRSALEP